MWSLPPSPSRSKRRVMKRSEEHTSELQSPCNLVCRLLLEKKKKKSPNGTVSRDGKTVKMCIHLTTLQTHAFYNCHLLTLHARLVPLLCLCLATCPLSCDAH